MQRAQTAAEYVMLVALIFVLIAAMMLQSFRQQEITLAISAARLACTEYSSINSSVSCYEIRYFYAGIANVTISPVTNILGNYQKDELQNRIIANMGAVFNPKNIKSGKCYIAPNYSYCIEFP
ncbi:MAG TPA: hypothetical protein VJI13_03515 [Candidatus Norongarragalinales archaeon]|nr:hypothetical protein [Candidatus Norongarragalinales archaeon]